jgi:hypothetical protein
MGSSIAVRRRVMTDAANVEKAVEKLDYFLLAQEIIRENPSIQAKLDPIVVRLILKGW